MNKKPYKHPPKLYVVKFGDTAFLYDETETNLCNSEESHYHLIFLNDLFESDKRFWVDENIYVKCSDINKVNPPDRVSVDDPGVNWYKFNNEDDENTEETYNKYLKYWKMNWIRFVEPLLFQYQYSLAELHSIFIIQQWIEITLDEFRKEQRDMPERLVELLRSFMNHLLIYDYEQHFKEHHQTIAKAIQNSGSQDMEKIIHEINEKKKQLIKYLEPQDEQKTLQTTSPKAVCR